MNRLVAVLAAAVFAGCSHAPPQEAAVPSPEPGKAVLVLLQAAKVRGTPSLYRLTKDGQEFIGRLAKRSKIAYQSWSLSLGTTSSHASTRSLSLLEVSDI